MQFTWSSLSCFSDTSQVKSRTPSNLHQPTHLLGIWTQLSAKCLIMHHLVIFVSNGKDVDSEPSPTISLHKGSSASHSSRIWGVLHIRDIISPVQKKKQFSKPNDGTKLRKGQRRMFTSNTPETSPLKSGSNCRIGRRCSKGDNCWHDIILTAYFTLHQKRTKRFSFHVIQIAQSPTLHHWPGNCQTDWAKPIQAWLWVWMEAWYKGTPQSLLQPFPLLTSRNITKAG